MQSAQLERQFQRLAIQRGPGANDVVQRILNKSSGTGNQFGRLGRLPLGSGKSSCAGGGPVQYTGRRIATPGSQQEGVLRRSEGESNEVPGTRNTHSGRKIEDGSCPPHRN